jgi:hypothetical protein
VATLLTRRFSTEKKIAALRQFRDCFEAQLGELQDTKSRVWREVSKDDHGVLNNWLELPPTAKSKK